MSGPWDRPSSADRDREWPSEESNARDPWSSGDSWGSAAPDASPGWDEWSAPPPPDDYVVEEPPPPSSDPWAESWADDAGMPSAPTPSTAAPTDDASRTEAGREAPPSPEPDAVPWTEPDAAPWPEPPLPVTPPSTPWGDEAAPSEPPATPWGDETEPSPRDELARGAGSEGVAGRAGASSEPYSAARIEPWSPELDPWTVQDAYGAADDGPAAPAAQEASGVQSPEALPHEPMDELELTTVASSPEAPPRERTDEPQVAPPPAEDEEQEDSAASTAEPPDAPSRDAAPSVWVPPASIQPAWTVTSAPAWPAAETLPDVREPADTGPTTAPEDEAAMATDAEAAPGLAAEDATAEPAEAPVEAPEEPAAEPPQRRSWWRPSAAPVWPPEPEESEEEPAASADADVSAGSVAAARAEPDATATVEPEPEWPGVAESTQVLPPSWRAPRPDTGPPAGDLRPSVAPVRTRLGTAEPEAEGKPAPSTAEQAVPWLIGVILLLAGMVIVLLALIFAGDASLGGAVVGPSPSDGSLMPSASAVAAPVASARPTPTPAATPMPSGDPTPTPVPIPEYGPHEMVYQGRSEALAHIYLLHRDFTTEDQPVVLAQDQSLDVRQFAWAPDGTVGVALYADLLVSVEPGREKRALGDEIRTATFGADASTVYAVRITEDGGDDLATILQIDFASAGSTEITAVGYPRPDVGPEDPLPEARFIDDGGPIRIFRLEDGRLRLWVLGAGAWDIDPGSGEVSEVAEGAAPTLWSPKGNRRVAAEEADGTTSLTLRNREDEIVATTSVEGLVSHLRWSPKGDMVVFTVGTSAPGGGVIQNLWVWYLEDGVAPTQMTDTGAAFGAEWLGSPALWRG